MRTLMRETRGTPEPIDNLKDLTAMYYEGRSIAPQLADICPLLFTGRFYLNISVE